MNKGEFKNFFEKNILLPYENEVEKGKKAQKKAVLMFVFFFFLVIITLPIFQAIAGTLGEIMGILLELFLFILYLGKGKNGSMVVKDLGRREEIKKEIMEKMTTALFPELTYQMNDGMSKEEFKQYSFISDGSIDIFRTEDVFVGKTDGRTFRISEAFVGREESDKDGTRVVPVFRGMITETETELDADFQLFITKKEYETRGKMGLQKMDVLNLYLDDNYNVFTNNPTMATKILQPSYTNKWVNYLQQMEQQASIGFYNGKIILLVNGYNGFSIFQKDGFDVDVLWDDFQQVNRTFKLMEKTKEMFIHES